MVTDGAAQKHHITRTSQFGPNVHTSGHQAQASGIDKNPITVAPVHHFGIASNDGHPSSFGCDGHAGEIVRSVRHLRSPQCKRIDSGECQPRWPVIDERWAERIEERRRAEAEGRAAPYVGDAGR